MNNTSHLPTGKPTKSVQLWAWRTTAARKTWGGVEGGRWEERQRGKSVGQTLGAEIETQTKNENEKRSEK